MTPREHPLSPHRVLPLALVALLGLVAAAAIWGPAWYQRLYHPLEYREVIGPAARRARIDPYLVTAVVHAESDFEPEIVSDRGAIGLMQVMPETAEDTLKSRGEDVKVTREMLEEPSFNVEIGSEYLAQLRERYDGDEALALAAYNAGVANADRWEREEKKDPVESIGFPETRHFVSKVLKERETYRRLYPEAYE